VRTSEASNAKTNSNIDDTWESAKKTWKRSIGSIFRSDTSRNGQHGSNPSRYASDKGPIHGGVSNPERRRHSSAQSQPVRHCKAARCLSQSAEGFWLLCMTVAYRKSIVFGERPLQLEKIMKSCRTSPTSR